jgi:hypothetical protein
MPYLFGFMCVLGMVRLVGCGATQLECQTGVDCDDQNDCTEDACDPASGACSHTWADDGTTCDFGGALGVCMSGECEEDLCAGIDCSDGNGCTEDICDPADGACSNRPVEDDTACDFSGFPGLCKAGVCEDAMLCEAVECNDDNECSEDACDPTDGMCYFTPKPDDTPCSDGEGTCLAGVCGACTGNANAAAYSELTYVNDDELTFAGTDAAEAIAVDCIFGSTHSTPPVTGCLDAAVPVIVCTPNCTEEVVNNLATCVADCTQETTTAIAAPGLSDGCVACTGHAAACSFAFCAPFGCGVDFNSQQCIVCRCANNCIQSFDTCSGLPPGGECN